MGDFLLRLIKGTTATGSGDTDPTVTRATTKVVQDHEGKLITIDSGEIAQNGARRVKNMMTASEDMTNGAYTDGAGATSSATSTVFDGTSNADVTQSITITDDGSGAEGRYFNFSVKISLDSGSISADNEVTIRVAGTAVTAGALELGTQLGATAKRFELIVATDAAGTTVIPEVECDSAVTLGITEWQVEEVTGQFSHTCGDYASVGVASDPWHGAGVDGVQYFSTHNGNTVASTGVVTDGTGADINSSNSQFGFTTGVSGTYFSAPDSAAGRISTDGTWIIYLVKSDWAIASGVFWQDGGGSNRSWVIHARADKKLNLITSSTGSYIVASDTNSTGTVPFADGTGGWIRITVDDSAQTASHYYSYDPPNTAPSAVTWTSIGAGIAHTSAGLYDTNAPVIVGSIVDAGNVLRAVAIASTDPTATPAVDFNPNDWDAGKTWTSSGTNSEIWTINGDASVAGPKALLWGDFPGAVADEFTTPSATANRITDDLTIIVYAALDDWTPAVASSFVSKWVQTSPGYRAYTLQMLTTGTLQLAIGYSSGSNGAGVQSSVATGFADGTGHWLRATWDNSANTLNYYTSDDAVSTAVASVSWSQLGTADLALVATGPADTTAQVEIGSIMNGTTMPLAGKIMRAVILASTDPTAAPSVDFNPNNHQSGSTFTAATGEVWTIEGNAAIEGGNFPAMPWTANGPNGLESEQAGTNILLQSNDFDTTWGSNASVLTDNYAVGPFGAKDAWRIIAASVGGSSDPQISQALTVSSGNTCFSFYVKADQFDWCALLAYGFDGSGRQFFDLVNGVVGSVDGTFSRVNDAGIESLPNGWYRCWIVFSTTSDLTGIMYLYPAEADLDVTTDLDGAGSILMYGAQVETGTYPTTYNATTTTSATRNKDQLSYAGASNAAYPLTGRVRYTPNQIDTIGVLLDVNDGTADDRVELSVTAAGKPRLLVRSGGSDVADITADDALVLGVSTLINFVVDTDDARLYVDEVATGTDDTSLAVPAEDATSINVGEDYNNVNQPNGLITDVGLANENQSTAEIISWNAE